MVYDSGNSLSDLKLICNTDMTTECCVAKLAYLMGRGYRGKQLKEQFVTDLRGELTTQSDRKRRVVQHIPVERARSDSSSQEEYLIEEHDEEEMNEIRDALAE